MPDAVKREYKNLLTKKAKEAHSYLVPDGPSIYPRFKNVTYLDVDRLGVISPADLSLRHVVVFQIPRVVGPPIELITVGP
jgi:hypothetical protein